MKPEKRRETISQNLIKVREKMKSAAAVSGRSIQDIDLIVVTKTWTSEIIALVIENGVRALGENRIQEAVPKIEQLNRKYDDLIWHMIGHLQSNKAGPAVANFSFIQSIDSVKIARRVSDIANRTQKKIDVLIEVNISGEAAKFGFSPAEIMPAADEIAELPGLNLRGLMTVGPLTPDKTKIRAAFAKMKSLYDDLKKRFPDTVDALSMGMSDDYEIAIEEGSTMVRLGRAIFGSRET